jgi:hypothetical protein
MRQEIFFAEGRRASDLGFRFPVCEIEAANTSSAAGYTEAQIQIPDSIAEKKEMDAFTMDATKKEVIIKYNMNKVIVENKEDIIPFFKPTKPTQ